MKTPELAPLLDGAAVLVTGGAGFVGSAIASRLAHAAPGARIVALDNLSRRGSELHLPALHDAGVRFVQGDVRNVDDIETAARDCDLLIDCAAETSASAGYGGSPLGTIKTNLVGTINCLEHARTRQARVVFLSTSRVYPVDAVNRIAVNEEPTRFAIASVQQQPGVTPAGIDERFTLQGPRTLYGATKLASELLLAEYGAIYGVPYVIDRFGVIAGPGQMGREDQGVFTLWMARHYFGASLSYRGWGGTGKQVRDLLHVDDAWAAVALELACWDRVNGKTYNVGGSAAVSLSLCETTDICREISGRRFELGTEPATHPSDVRVYVSDSAAIRADLGWVPANDARTILGDIYAWIERDAHLLAPIFGANT